MSSRTSASRRTVLTAALAGPAAAAVGPDLVRAAAHAGAPSILKALPADRFVDFGTNAEMRWDSVDPGRELTRQADLFVRNHTATPTIDRSTYALRVFGDGLVEPRTADDAHALSWDDLRALPPTSLTAVHECTGNGRSFFASQQGKAASGTAWQLGSVGTVTWEGVRLRTVLRRLGLSPDAVSVMATGLDAPYSTGGVDYGRVRRPFPIAKALDDAILAWSANGAPLLPDHGYPLRLVLPGWVGIASIKWLGSLEVARTELTSPWNTKWYRMTGDSYPVDAPPLTVNPVRSAWELAWNATLPVGVTRTLTGRSWSGAGAIAHVDVSLDGGTTWTKARIEDDGTGHGRGHRRGTGWARWSVRWRPAPGTHTVMARATDRAGRVQPLVTPHNDNGYFFDAVVRHPVTVA